MKRILADVRAFGIQYLRSRVGAFFALIFPLILILLFGSIFSQTGSARVTLYVQDLDSSWASQEFVRALNYTNVTVIAYIPTTANFTGYVSEHSINVALQIPKGFRSAVENASAGKQNVSSNLIFTGDVTQSTYQIAFEVVNQVATQFNFRIARAQPVIGVRATPFTRQSFSYIDFFVPGVIGFTVLTTPLFGMTSICAEYRTRRFFKLLATTRLSKPEWLAAKVIFYVVLMFVSVALMFAAGILVFGMKATLTPLAILLIVAGTVEFTSLGMLLGIFVKDAETAAAIANAIGFPMMFLAGTFFPIESMPPFLQSIARVLPLTFLNEGLRATMVFGSDTTAVNYLLLTLAFAAVLFVIPARALSWKSK